MYKTVTRLLVTVTAGDSSLFENDMNSTRTAFIHVKNGRLLSPLPLSTAETLIHAFLTLCNSILNGSSSKILKKLLAACLLTHTCSPQRSPNTSTSKCSSSTATHRAVHSQAPSCVSPTDFLPSTNNNRIFPSRESSHHQIYKRWGYGTQQTLSGAFFSHCTDIVHEDRLLFGGCEINSPTVKIPNITTS